MSRLPTPGADKDTWGQVLNDFLSQAHAPDGFLKNNSVSNNHIIAVDSSKVTGLAASLAAKTDISILTAKGDLYAATASGTLARMAAGTNGQVLTADSTAATGLRWATTTTQVYNVRDYGAAGDGSTDDQSAIQDTIDAAQTAGGGIVFFPQGTYIVSGTPQITGSNIIVQGVGMGSKILLASAALNATGVTLGIWVNGGSNVLIENLLIDGNFSNVAKNGTFHGASALWSPIISKYGATSVKNYSYAGTGIDATTYLKYRAPIRITDANNVVVQNCLIENSISAGVLVDAAAVNGCTNIMVTNCRIRMCWDNGVYFHQGVQYGSAVDNIISDLVYNGVCAVYCDHILFANNNISFCGPSDSDSGGIQINGTSNCSATGNIIDQCQFYGVVCQASQETNITGGQGGNQVWSTNSNVSNNHISACRANDYPAHISSGISVFGGIDSTLVGNTIDGCDKGISFGSQSINTSIIDNSIINSVSWGIEVGNATDVINTIIKSNRIARNGSTGIYCYTPVRIENNIIQGNNGHGIELAAKPAGLPQKIDYIINNSLTDNTDSGVYANGGANALAVIKGNSFGNSQEVVFSDGVANSTSTFTSASAAFTVADTGRTVVVTNQGVNGVTTTTTVSSVTNGTTIVLGTSLPVSQSGLTFSISRGPRYYADGSTDTGANATLTSASAAFSVSDVGKLVTLYSLDPAPRVLATGTIASRISATQVTLSTKAGPFPAVAFMINRSQGQQIRAINALSQIFDIDNIIHGMPELLAGGTTSNLIHSSAAGFPAAGAVSYWKFDEGTGAAVDDILQLNNGTWAGTLGSQWATGKINSGGAFNGTNNEISCGNNTSLNMTNAVTISLWLYPAATQNGFACPLAKSGAYWLEGDGGGTNQYQFFLNTGADQSAGLIQLAANTWQHFVLTWDGATAITYLNGIVANTQALSGTLSTNTNALLFGNRTGFSRYYTGRLDEMGIWSRALSAIEIGNLYNMGHGLQYGDTIVG